MWMESNPAGIIEVPRGVYDSSNHLPLLGRKGMLPHLFINDAKALLLDIPSCLDETRPIDFRIVLPA